MAEGTPEQVAKEVRSYTGSIHLAGRKGRDGRIR